MKILRKNIKFIIGMMIGIIIASGISAYAVYKCNASEVKYSDSKNVAQVLDELYQNKKDVEQARNEGYNTFDSSRLKVLETGSFNSGTIAGNGVARVDIPLKNSYTYGRITVTGLFAFYPSGQYFNTINGSSVPGYISNPNGNSSKSGSVEINYMVVGYPVN